MTFTSSRPTAPFWLRAPRSGVLSRYPELGEDSDLRTTVRPEPRTLGTVLDPSANSLNALRLLFAAAVVISHAWWLGAYGPEPSLFGIKLGTAGVMGFFAVSGYLVTLSAERSTSVAPFALARCLRIFPGLIVASISVAFVAAPLGALLTGGEYDLGSAFAFIGEALVLLFGITGSPTIGTSLLGNNDPAWNGPLWSLTWEVLCYAFIAFVVFMLRRGSAERYAPRVTILLFSGMTILTAGQFNGNDFEPERTSSVLPFIVLFLAGSVVAHYRERVRIEMLPMLLAAELAWAFLATGLGPALAALPLAYLVLAAGSLRKLAPIGARHDISYGVYIYGWPIQQLLAALHLPAFLPPLAYATVALIAVWPVAFLSCILVEQPAQRWRRNRQRRQNAKLELVTAH